MIHIKIGKAFSNDDVYLDFTIRSIENANGIDSTNTLFYLNHRDETYSSKVHNQIVPDQFTVATGHQMRALSTFFIIRTWWMG